MSHLQITIPVQTDLQKEIMIAELDAIGFEAFEEEENKLKAFVKEDLFDRSGFNELMEHYGLKPGLETIQEKNWNEEWEKNFLPVQVGDFCSVRACFHPPNTATTFDLVITPKMSFGTGHHATTFLMLQLMQQIEFKDRKVFDFGTGTGILAILAEKMGAREVTAIDMDPWSVENAMENLVFNKCQNVKLYRSNNIPADQTFKIILANINRNVILESLPVMCKSLSTEGDLLLSGLMSADFDLVNGEAIRLGLRLTERLEREGWIATRYILNDYNRPA